MSGSDKFTLERRTLMKAGVVVTAAASTRGAHAEPAAKTATPAAPAGKIGSGMARADGRLKVSGGATYAIEHSVPNLAYGVCVGSTIAAGRITAIDTAAAEKAPGVLAVYTHLNRLEIKPARRYFAGGAATENFGPLVDDEVRWNGQHIAFVVAETFEQATEAAALIVTTYAGTKPILNPDDAAAKPDVQAGFNTEWGDPKTAFEAAPIKLDAVYTTPRNYNVPMEPHACIAAWTGETLTVWEPSQWVGGAQQVISEWMGLPVGSIRVISPYVGGGFGSKVAPHGHVALACAAARRLGRPVKTSLTRPQTFVGYGGRPRTRQAIKLGATADGRLLSIVHEGSNETAINDLHVEPTNSVTAIMYASPNFWSRHSVVPVNTVTPSWVRAPGENPSAYALETAMDELAYKVGVDPVELRLRNWADQDPKAKLPWSTRRLKEAYLAGAEAFGWSKRTPQPRSMREGRALIGWGMAAGTYPLVKAPGEATLVLHADGRVEVLSAGVDIGTGTYTILAQMASSALGVPVERVSVRLGDTTLPRSTLAGGSQLAGVLTSAVQAAAQSARKALIDLAVTDPGSPLRGARAEDLDLIEGKIRPTRRPAGGVDIADLLRATGRDRLEVKDGTNKSAGADAAMDAAAHSFAQLGNAMGEGFSTHAWAAHFVEVRVDPDFGAVRVSRMVSAFDSGFIYNPKLAESQWKGGMIMGIGQALFEEGALDPRDGRIINGNLADYVVPVNADIPDLRTISVGVPDYRASALGGKAVGEIGICGVAPAIGNAVFHATGKRIRDLPFTLDKLIQEA
jgi:xanthine dehydrogenase YagR molybdenum-binding subunit